MKYRVKARAYKKDSMEIILAERKEVIDIETNKLFEGVPEDPFEIRQRYEHFWNDVNPNNEKVFVMEIEKVD